MVTLDPMTPSAWDTWHRSAVRDYAADKVRAGTWFSRRGAGALSGGVLHVFGDNQVARELYRSSGYVETDVMMRKTLG